MTTLALILAESSAQCPDRVAVRHDNRTLCYAELDRAAARCATFLAERGVRPGDTVGLMLPNIPEFAIGHYGIMRAGGVVVPMNPLLRARPPRRRRGLSHDGVADVAAHAADGAGAAAAEPVTVDAEFAHALRPHQPQVAPVPCADDDVAVLLCTSGTTGKPKGAELTQRGVAAVPVC